MTELSTAPASGRQKRGRSAVISFGGRTSLSGPFMADMGSMSGAEVLSRGQELSQQVQVLQRYANVPRPLKLVQTARKILASGSSDTVPIGESRRVHRVEQRLEPAVIEQLLEDYRSGISSAKLVEKYGLAKATILRLLDDHDVPRNPRTTLSDAQVTQAIAWYEQGWTTKEIGTQLGRHGETIRLALKRAGLTLRGPGRTPR